MSKLTRAQVKTVSGMIADMEAAFNDIMRDSVVLAHVGRANVETSSSMIEYRQAVCYAKRQEYSNAERSWHIDYVGTLQPTAKHGRPFVRLSSAIASAKRLLDEQS